MQDRGSGSASTSASSTPRRVSNGRARRCRIPRGTATCSVSSTPKVRWRSASPDDRDAFLAQYQTTLVEQHGRVMQEFVVVPGELLERTDELAGWFARTYDWIGTLKPKPTKRSSKPWGR
jgi:hypothetical protein